MAFKLVELIDGYFTGSTPDSDWYQIPGKLYKK